MRLLGLLLAFALSSCSDEKGMQNLKQDLANKKNAVVQNLKKKPSDEMLRLVPVTYREGSRTPFQVTAAILNAKNAIQPLNMFSIDTLRFVGTVSQGHKKWAIIITPDNLTYKVKQGDTLGDHYGKITSIEANEIKIMESFTGNEKSVTQRVVTLQLKDEH